MATEHYPAWARRTPVCFSSLFLVVCLPVATLVVFGLRLLDQDRALARQRQIERLDIAADHAVQVFQQKLSSERERLESPCAPAELPEDSLCVVFRGDRIETVPAGRLPYYPLSRSLPEAPEGPFRELENREFNHPINHDKALEMLLLSASPPRFDCHTVGRRTLNSSTSPASRIWHARRRRPSRPSRSHRYCDQWSLLRALAKLGPSGRRCCAGRHGPHEIDRLFFSRCRMERPWPHFDFAVDVGDVYERKLAAISAYESVFQGEQASLVERYRAEDQYVGSLLGVRFAEPFKARTPLLVDTPLAFQKVRLG